MCKRFFEAVILTILCQIWIVPAMSQSEQPTDMPPRSVQTTEVLSIRPDYLPPLELLDILGAQIDGNRGILEWQMADGWHMVDIRHNDAANLLIISGIQPDLEYIEALIREADVPPRQIEIEVKIIEVSTSKAQDLGIDWEWLLSKSRPRFSWAYGETDTDRIYRTIQNGTANESITDDYRENSDWDLSQSVYLSDVLKLLDSSGAATIRTAPRILTLNNRRATILDGQRVTYITRYSSYTNLYEVDSLDAGLTLSVLPSLGESGYITLHINAELTSLGSSISGSPIKDGQMVENTVIVMDGESVLLGGLSRTFATKGHKRFPILGHILPGIFSREITIDEEVESIMILTPRVVDFETALDDESLEMLEGE